MLDRAWLEKLDFVGRGGVHVHGLEAIGGESVVLRATLPDGTPVVQKMRKHHLGFHIRELPLFMTDEKPHYSVDRLNQKLFRLMGNPLLDAMTRDYDRLYSSLIRLLEKTGVPGLILASSVDGLRRNQSIKAVDAEEAMKFILGTPGIKRRLGDWAALAEEYQDPSESIITVNGPNFPFTKVRFDLIRWAKKTLAEVEALPAILRPSSLAENPIYVWGAAVTDGFYTEAELPQAAAFLNERFGPLRRHPQAVIFLQQAKSLAFLLGYYLKDSRVARFAQFCEMLGFRFELEVRNFTADEAEEEADDDEQPPATQSQGAEDPPDFEFSPLELLGRALAQMHTSASHGDLHPDNFGFDPVSKKFVFYDFSRAKVLSRPLTCEERVNDLLPLRRHFKDIDWLLVFAGYRAEAPADASRVFALIEEQSDLGHNQTG